MDKRKVIEQIQEYLTEELASLEQAAKASYDATTNDESRAESEYDTRAIEASYLAGAQAQRAEEVRKLLLMYRFMPLREYGEEDVACPGALIELEYNATRAFYFLAPQGGGLITRVDGQPVQVITPVSPMGEALLGKRQGDTIEVETKSGTREYELLKIS